MKAILNLTLYTVRLLPESFILILAKLLGTVLHLLHFRRMIITENIKEVFPQMSHRDRKKFRKKVYRHFGLLIFEILRQAYYEPLQTAKKIDSTQLRDKLLPEIEKGRGVCILTGHIGNWELAGVTLAKFGIDNFTTVKEMKSGIGNYLLYRIRDKNGSVTVNRKNAMRAVIKQLREGKVVTFVLDQNMNRKEAIFADFFGKKAATMASLATIVKKTGPVVIPGALFRNADLKSFYFYLGDTIDFINAESPKTTILTNTEAYNHALEQMILKHPEQWIWMHKRWRTRPIN